MTAHEPKPPLPSAKKSLSVEVDFERYTPLLESADISEDQKHELLQALWSIIIGFVDLGFEVTPASYACGQFAEKPTQRPITKPDALYSKHRKLIEEFIAADQTKEAAK